MGSSSSSKKKQLGDYARKRDAEATPEPDEGEVRFSWSEGRPVFVIQKHDASTLHYDLRLEVEGVLKSWAVPKGPSTDPSEKRLAVPTEDHPLKYADFEGVIPEDQYGGGTVQIWDRGRYQNLKDDVSVSEQLDDGHATVWLEGEKIRGGYALTRTSRGKDEKWLLVKMDDEESDARRNPTSTENESVRSGCSVEEIAEEEADDDD